VAAFVGVGLAASLTLVLVLLPTLEDSIRSDRANAEARAVYSTLQNRSRAFTSPFSGEEIERRLSELQADLGGDVRFDIQGATFFPAVSSVRAYLSTPAGRRLRDAAELGVGARAVESFDGQTVVIAALPVPGQISPGGVLSAAVPVRGLGSDLAVVRRRVLLAVIAVLALASLVGFALARALGRRIRGLAGTAAKLAGGDLSARAPEARPAELTSLGESLNGMAERLESLLAETLKDRDRANTLIGSLAEGVVAVSPAGELTAVNAAAQRHLGLPPVGSVRLEALPAAVADVVRRALADPALLGVADEVELPGGNVFALEVTPLPDRAEGVVLTLRDVTDERRLERARRDLVANVSHELKTPLTALTGFIELLEDPRLDPARRREFVELMAGEAARLDRLVEEQLELARLDSGRLRLEREPLDLGALAVGVVASRRALAEREGVLLTADPPPAEPVVVDADGARLEQILLILLDNALRHTPSGGRVRVSVEGEGETATLAVSDTGEGIRADAQPFVFDRFYQADPSREGRGSGLGLAIARGLAQAHGGAIELRSAAGQGSTFTLRLPLTAAAPPVEPSPSPAGAGSSQ
jgi:signal transduction histidine kinase